MGRPLDTGEPDDLKTVLRLIPLPAELGIGGQISSGWLLSKLDQAGAAGQLEATGTLAGLDGLAGLGATGSRQQGGEDQQTHALTKSTCRAAAKATKSPDGQPRTAW